MTADTSSSSPPTPTLEQRVNQVIELIRPSVKDDGGDIELVAITPDKIVQIRFKGQCITCPSSDMTLKHDIKANVIKRVPEITDVVAVA